MEEGDEGFKEEVYEVVVAAVEHSEVCSESVENFALRSSSVKRGITLRRL